MRLIKQGAISIVERKVDDPDTKIEKGLYLIKAGKKKSSSQDSSQRIADIPENVILLSNSLICSNGQSLKFSQISLFLPYLRHIPLLL